MKKYLSLVVGATALLGTTMGMSQVANAQAATGAASGPFADVPADHWAYTAVNTLQKAGIVIGYPDGTYGGRRAMTRYEFAVAIARLLPMINPPVDLSGYAKTSDLQAFEDDVNGKLQAQQDALDALKALVNEFQPELQQLGEDVTAIKTRLDADEQRLAVVEEEQRRVKITGELNMVAIGNINTNTSDADALDQNGYRVGVPGSKSIFSDINVYEDFLLTIDGRVSDTAHAVVKIDAGNYLSHLGSYESQLPGRDENGIVNGAESTDDSNSNSYDTFSIYEAYLDVPISLGPLSGAEAQLGRFGEQYTPFTFKAVNPDIYTVLPETNGDIVGDGVKVVAGIGGAHVNVFAEKNDNASGAYLTGGPSIAANSGAHLPGSGAGGDLGDTLGVGGQENTNQITQTAGARVTFGDPNNYTIGVSGVLASVSPTGYDDTGFPTGPADPYNGKLYNNLGVYGVDFHGILPIIKSSGITLDGEFANSSTGYNSQFGNVNDKNGTEAYYGELGYTFGPVNVKGGYKEVYGNFAAPGYWGVIGDYTNPSNIKGGIVSASYAITPSIKLVGDGNFFQGIYNVGDQSPLGKNDDLTSYDVGLKYGLSSTYGIDLGYEWVQWNLKNQQGLLDDSGKPTQQYITFGIGHQFNANTSLKLMYQIIQYSDKGTGFDPAANGGDENGGVALTQLSVKF